MSPLLLPPSFRVIRTALCVLLLGVFGAAGGLLVVTGAVDAVVDGGVRFAEDVRASWSEM